MTEAAARRVHSSKQASNPWLVLLVLLAIYVLNFGDRYLLTGLIGPIKAEFGLGDGFMGLLMGPAFVVLYVVAGVPLARLADRTSRVRIIAAGCVVWSLATVATGFATGPVWLALSRVGVGIGEAAFIAPALSLVTDYFPIERRGLALAILSLATYLGQILGQGGGPAIAAVSGWRHAFWSIGAAGVIMALVALASIREPARASAGAASPQIPLARLIALIRQSRTWVLVTAAMAFGTLSGVSFGYWAPELFARSLRLDPVTVKAAFAVNFGLSGLVGMFLFGLLADRLSRRGMEWPARLAAISMGSTTLLIIAASWAPNFALVSLLAVPSGLLGGGWSVGVHATMQYLLPPGIRASGTALYIAVATLVGQVGGPFGVGLLSDALGGDGHALRLAMTLVMPLGLIGAACAWLASRHVEAERAELERQV